MSEKSEYFESLKAALSGFGLNEAETAVYAAALRLGTRQASRIAKAAGLNRAYTYDILNSLKSKGLVEEGMRNNVKHYSCTPPEHLLLLMRQREEEVCSQRKLLQEALPKLAAFQARLLSNNGIGVRSYQSEETFPGILEQIAENANGTVRAMLTTEALGAIQSNEFLADLLLRDDTLELKTLGFADTKLPPSQRLNYRRAAEQLSGLDVILSNQTVYVFSIAPTPLALMITHETLYFAAVQIFESLWRMSDWISSDRQ